MDKYAPTATHPAETPTGDPILPACIQDLLAAARAVEKRLERAIPVQLATLNVLIALAADPDITLTPLAAKLGVERQTVHGTLKRVDALGLLSKARDEKDARVSHFRLTLKGHQVLGECRSKLAPVTAKLGAMINATAHVDDLADQLENMP